MQSWGQKKHQKISKITVLDYVKELAEVEKTQETTVLNCFKKCGSTASDSLIVTGRLYYWIHQCRGMG
jgi:hypothetical protein